MAHVARLVEIPALGRPRTPERASTNCWIGDDGESHHGDTEDTENGNTMFTSSSVLSVSPW